MPRVMPWTVGAFNPPNGQREEVGVTPWRRPGGRVKGHSSRPPTVRMYGTTLMRAETVQRRLENHRQLHAAGKRIQYANGEPDAVKVASPVLGGGAALWTQVVLRLFPQPLRINGRCVVVGDGIKIPKRGRKMPAVKLLHQQSESNTKPEYITGHSLQAVSVLVQAAASVFAVPLAIRIHEGVVWSNRDRRTLLDKMLALLGIVAIAHPVYFVADAYYAARKIVTGPLDENNHLVTRVKSNAVAYTVHQQPGPRKRGRPRVYGRKVKLSSLLQDPKGRQQAKSPVYGERQVVIQYKV